MKIRTAILSAAALIIAVCFIPAPLRAQHAGEGKNHSPTTLAECESIRAACHDACRAGIGQTPADGSPFTAYLLQCNVNCEAAFRSCTAHLPRALGKK